MVLGASPNSLSSNDASVLQLYIFHVFHSVEGLQSKCSVGIKEQISAKSKSVCMASV